jgi:hypothetical protein
VLRNQNLYQRRLGVAFGAIGVSLRTTARAGTTKKTKKKNKTMFFEEKSSKATQRAINEIEFSK